MNELDIAYVQQEVAAATEPLRVQIAALDEKLAICERTIYGMQQMLGKAAEYQGKPRGKLPRDRKNGR